jgi:probable F420-dependent oxidoreductase
MRFGLTLAHTHIARWEEVTVLAEELGLESVWLPDHLVFPLDIAGTPYADGGSPPVSTGTPLFDCPAYLGFLAAKTSTLRLGTYVHLLGLRHPLVAARGFATADVLSRGRISVGVGAGWLESEWRAAGYDPATRGARLDEAMAVTRRLWTDDVIEHAGRFWAWEPVCFEPKPVQPGGPPLLVGGESRRALRRAAELGDGWMSLPHASLATVEPQLAVLRELREAAGRADDPFEVTVCVLDPPPPDEIAAWAAAGVDRLIVRPWQRVRDTIDGLARFAASHAEVMER